jgi:hypothetical protein
MKRTKNRLVAVDSQRFEGSRHALVFRNTAFAEVGMNRQLCVIALWVVVLVLSAQGQTPSSKYQPSTIMAVTAHQSSGQHDPNVTQYDVSLKVGNTSYTILYTPPNGANTVTYAMGDELLVLVGSNTLAFNTPFGKVEAPILHRESLPMAKTIGPDFAIKLALTDSQQAEITPMLKQEAGQVEQLCANSGLSRAEKMSQYENIVRASDEQIKPLLSASQGQKLHDLRKEQKQDLKKMLAEQKLDNQK